MLQYLIFGSGFAFAAAIQPGPLQTFFITKVVQQGWRRTLPAALAPLITDGPIALLMLLVLRSVPAGLTSFLRTASGIVLITIAVLTYRSWRRPAGEHAEGSAPATLLQAVTVNFLNPGPYLGWGVIFGPVVLQQWAVHPQNAIALVASFYVTMVITLALTILLFGTTSFLDESTRRWLVLVAALTLALLGVWQLVLAIQAR